MSYIIVLYSYELIDNENILLPAQLSKTLHTSFSCCIYYIYFHSKTYFLNPYPIMLKP
ncbi:hypothetical protein B879_03056 [Cecembia lonarensis LW9]|uniref:Uncharacterized protein n=1 Tax=Cecembia lonarensis (strain CCUG 58316 / KCTC 22772 / LW9) TaxID=1225176 RepID=K1KW15_CECL9|nr:hypothetical protein B879_03056 [Cecembia lonarensis LW9]